MTSPLSIDQATVKEFGITKNIDLPTEFKLAYVKAQIDEFKKMLYRSRIDIILSTKLMDNEIEALAEKGRQNRTEKRHEVKQFASALEVLNKLQTELEA